MASLSVRFPEELEHRLEELSQVTGRTRSFLAIDALRRYLNQEEWQTQAIKTAVDRADSGEARYASHESVDAWLESWGSEQEKEPPKCE